jgi:hypothetical protein
VPVDRNHGEFHQRQSGRKVLALSSHYNDSLSMARQGDAVRSVLVLGVVVALSFFPRAGGSPMVQVDVEEYERDAARLAEGSSTAAKAALAEVVDAVRKIESKRRRSLRPMTKGAILLIAYGIFLIAAYCAGRDYVPPPKPDGEIVEILHNPHYEGGFTYSERSYQLWRYADANQFEQHSPRASV